MYLYEMTEEQAAQIRKELSLSNKQGMFHTIVSYIQDEFGRYGGKFKLEHCYLQKLGSELDTLKTHLLYHDKSVQLAFQEDWVCYFDFDKDVCNIRDLILQNISLDWLPDTLELIIKVNIDVIIGVLKYEVFKYLNKKETKNDESREEQVD